jgi:hypothetical protein
MKNMENERCTLYNKVFEWVALKYMKNEKKNTVEHDIWASYNERHGK